MIKIDISNVWGSVEFADLMAIEKEVAAAHATLAEGNGAGKEYLGWLNLPTREVTPELARIQAAAEKIRANSDVFVVIGIGGSYLGSRAAIELLQGPNRNIGKGKGDPQIFYAGNSLSTRHWNELCRLLDEKDFSIAIISKSGTTTEPAVATRALRWMLERNTAPTAPESGSMPSPTLSRVPCGRWPMKRAGRPFPSPPAWADATPSSAPWDFFPWQWPG